MAVSLAILPPLETASVAPTRNPTARRKLGIVGAGKLATALARAALTAGYEVAIAGSGPAARISLQVEVLAPGAKATTVDGVVQFSDLIVLAVPTAASGSCRALCSTARS
jgi:predicted dinucleotide-binding enzyme